MPEEDTEHALRLRNVKCPTVTGPDWLRTWVTRYFPMVPFG